MSSEVKVNKISPASATSTTLGDSGDSFTIPSGVTLDVSNATVNLPSTLTVTTETKTNKLAPGSGTDFTFGDSGDTFTIPSGVTVTNSGTATGFGGVPTLISSTTCSNTALVSLTFGASYKTFMINFIGIRPATDGAELQFKDTNSSTQNNVGQHWYLWSNSGGGNFAQSGHTVDNNTNWCNFMPDMGNDQEANCEMWVFEPASTSKVKKWYSDAAYFNNADEQQRRFCCGFWNVNATAIDGVQFQCSSGNITSGVVEFWGFA